jgi:hypothetical protein
VTTFRSQYMAGLVRLMYPNARIEPCAESNTYRIVHIVTYSEVVAARDNHRVLVDKIEGKRWKRRRLHWGKKH